MTQTLLVGPAGSSILLTLRASSLKRALRDVEVQMQPLTYVPKFYLLLCSCSG